jgi:UDP-3-O-[3-hydroxymyristoyl] N-acetylglucosamine deacetylase / 3-hydroxyacyl-[acyl-carrier-protein] dehydratase
LRKQRTIENEVTASGKGLFSGVDAKITFKPAPQNKGIVFVRTDVDPPVAIPATVDSLITKDRRTALGKGELTVEMTEHCLASARALQIDNMYIEITAFEMPGFDASSLDYFKLLRKAGLREQQADQPRLEVKEPVFVSEGDATICAMPSNSSNLHINYDLDYTQHTGIGRQLYSADITEINFERNLAAARTFLLEAEALQFQAMGIGKHLGPKDVLVINSDGPIKNSYRMPDECVKHKMLDLIGDLALIGVPLVANIAAFKSGHVLNQKLARKLRNQYLRHVQMTKTGTDALLDITRIQKILPHRYPFLLVDKVLEIIGDTEIVGLKNVTYNELFFQGHFPTTPIMPGVLIVEALAQISGLLFAQRLENTGRIAVLLTMDGVKIRKSVVPGDQLILKAKTKKVRSRTAQCRAEAFVADSVVAEADLKFMLMDD